MQKEDLQVATYLMNYDPFLRYIATLCLKGKEEMKQPPNPKKDKEAVVSDPTSGVMSPNLLVPGTPEKTV